MADLKSKIESNAAVVGVLGLGYVGLPLALEFARKGLRVRGFDVDAGRVRALRSGRSYIGDVASSLLREQTAAGRFRAEHGFDAVSGCDALIICVPTPLRKTKEPDVSYILSAASEVARRLAKGRLVVLESTTYPGTTRE
ncbi:MAG: NAD(P)-binding domain-containing protein, partial [Elusimicrobiota bacterium]